MHGTGSATTIKAACGWRRPPARMPARMLPACCPHAAPPVLPASCPTPRGAGSTLPAPLPAWDRALAAL
jgi:hypothetical protein